MMLILLIFSTCFSNATLGKLGWFYEVGSSPNRNTEPVGSTEGASRPTSAEQAAARADTLASVQTVTGQVPGPPAALQEVAMPTESDSNSAEQPAPPMPPKQIANIKPMPRNGPHPRSLATRICKHCVRWSFYSNWSDITPILSLGLGQPTLSPSL